MPRAPRRTSSKSTSDTGGARSLWSGSISFGLVTIPVRLTTAVRDRTVRFNMLTPDGSCRLRQKLYCPETGKEYSFKDAARGFEVAPDQFVIVDQKEIAKLAPEGGRTIDIAEFVPLDQIDPIFFDRTYWLAPGSGGERAYALLAATMQRAGQVAVARFVMREREHLAVLRARDQAILLHTMYYDDELVAPPKVPSPRRASAAELKAAEELVRQLTDTFDPNEYRDDFRDKLERAVRAKAKGAKIVAAGESRPTAPVGDLMDALRRSLESSGSARRTRGPTAPRRPARRTARPRKTRGGGQG